jgi:hypothetical protein
MDEMIAANPHAISVTGKDNHLSPGIREFQSGGKRNGPAVEDMEDIGPEISGQPPRAANPTHQSQVREDVHLFHCPQKNI